MASSGKEDDFHEIPLATQVLHDVENGDGEDTASSHATSVPSSLASVDRHMSHLSFQKVTFDETDGKQGMKPLQYADFGEVPPGPADTRSEHNSEPVSTMPPENMSGSSMSRERTRTVPYETAPTRDLSPPRPSEEEPREDQSRNAKCLPTPTQWIISFLLLTVIALLIVLILTLTSDNGAPDPPISGTLQEPGMNDSPGSIPSSVKTVDIVIQRGELRCGIVSELSGFSMYNQSSGTYDGFEADLCRAIAAAVLGTGGKVTFVPVTTTDRFHALANGTVDVLASHNTQTMERDVYEQASGTGFTFTVPYLYDGLVFAGQPDFVDCADNQITDGNCTDLGICVVKETTHAAIVSQLFPDSTGIIDVLDPAEAFQLFIQSAGKRCNVLAGGQFEVAESIFRERTGSTDEYVVSTVFHSYEPLSLVSRDDDAYWSDMVQWTLQSLIIDEETTMETSWPVRLPTTTSVFGTSRSSLFQDAVAAVGNYAELYDRHLQSIMSRSEINKINVGDSGLIFSIPFGNTTVVGPGLDQNGTLQKIIDRGFLRCGIALFPGLANFDSTSDDWQGFDVDFCKAISAAIFFGSSSNVVYIDLPATERFTALANGDVDVLSRYTTWTLERDILEPTSGVGFDFSQVNFFDSTMVGGIPPYNACADRGSSQSACTGLKVCVNDGTTTIEIARRLFPDQGTVVSMETAERAALGLINGDCNAIIGSSLEVAESTVRAFGFTGNYQMGTTLYSKEPLALVSRQDDPQFSSFVKWVVDATFYAEEENIGQANATEMPSVMLFGTRYRRMLINAIQAVGSYGEIYNRHLEDLLASTSFLVHPFPRPVAEMQDSRNLACISGVSLVSANINDAGRDRVYKFRQKEEQVDQETGSNADEDFWKRAASTEVAFTTETRK